MTSKQCFMMFLAFTLVALFCATGVFADSPVLSDYITPTENVYYVLTVDDSTNTATITNKVSGNRQFAMSRCVSASGSITFNCTPSTSGVPTGDLFTIPPTYIVSSSITNCIGCTSVDNQNVSFDGSLYGSFDFEFTFNTASTGPTFRTGVLNGSLTSMAFTFDSLTVDGVTVVSDVVGEVYDFSIPSGYALVIDGACEILERDYYINNSWNFVGEGTGNRTNGSSERIISRSQIVDGFSPDKNLSRSQLIQWEALNPNLFGTASNYEFSGRDLVTVSSGAAFVVSYPLYDGVIPLNGSVRQFENSVNFVGSLYLNYTTRPTIRYVALKSNTQLDNNNVSFYNTFQPTSYDEPASEVVGTDSTVISPPSDAPTGGGNAGEPPLDEEQSIFGFLGRFINRVTNLFNQASEAIHSISGACQSFFAALLGMFSWLPPEWTAVLWGFFLILACVGVVKLFL